MKPIIPQQEKGGKSATTYSLKVAGVATAQALYKTSRENLLNVNQWHQLAGPSSAVFRVITEDGNESNANAKEGNYLRINIPAAPGAKAGDGFDWVKVEKIVEESSGNSEFTCMRVRPAVPPFYNQQEVAHFFTRDATSTFCVERKGRKLTAAVYGRNERPNTKVHNFLNKLRNVLVAVAAIIGLNKPQWKSLVKGLVNNARDQLNVAY